MTTLHDPGSATAAPLPTAEDAAISPSILTTTQVFTVEQLAELNQKSNGKGALQLAGHLTVLGLSGGFWLTHIEFSPLAILALLIYGFSLATTFAALHECCHRTAFANPTINDAVAWLAGLLSFYNSTYYRRYHKWHHRYTQLPGQDPELSDPLPTSLATYLWQISAIPWWWGKLRGHWQVATGQIGDCPFIPETAQAEVIRSVRSQLCVYGLAIATSVYLGQPWFLWAWLLPLALGQPFLRMILLAEHTGCSQDSNPMTNTRTTLTLAPIRFWMWNMPYHAEHHFCPSMPFHALGKAHQALRPHLQHLDSGYLNVNAQLVQSFASPVN